MEKTLKRLSWSVGVLIVLVAIIGGTILFKPAPEPVVGSVARGSEYHPVTMSATTSSYYTFKDGAGTLGQVVINAVGTGSMLFYDATSTNVNLRQGNVATTSLKIVASIWESQAVGNYIYDAVFVNGLLGVFNGTQGTSTLMYR